VKSLITEGIVLSRTNYGEADRILTILTPDQGKLRLMARGVRKIKSKLAGGVELFSISELSYISGKKEIGTLVSSRLKTHYGHIVEDIDRVQLGYEFLKIINKITEDHPEAIYFDLLAESFVFLDNFKVGSELIRLWFLAQLLKVSGHTPNLVTDDTGKALEQDKKYSFNFDEVSFSNEGRPNFYAKNIKLLRLLFGNYNLDQISKLEDVDSELANVKPLIEKLLGFYLPQARI
jgi:DNA repair protein RecO